MLCIENPADAVSLGGHGARARSVAEEGELAAGGACDDGLVVDAGGEDVGCAEDAGGEEEEGFGCVLIVVSKGCTNGKGKGTKWETYASLVQDRLSRILFLDEEGGRSKPEVLVLICEVLEGLE